MSGAWLAAVWLAVAARAAGPGRPAAERVLLRTGMGDIVLALYPEAAPRHARQILELVRLGAYDTVPVFRVMPGYLVQFGSVRSRRLPLGEAQIRALRPLPLEAGRMAHRRGALTMSRRPEAPDSAESSFSILLRDAPHLDGKYTVFGEVERGMEVVDALAALPLDEQQRPRDWTEVARALALGEAEVARALAAPRPPSPDDARHAALTWLLGAMLLLAAGAALSSGTPRVLRCACLLEALLALFALLLAVAPRLARGGWRTAVLFAAALGVFKLLSSFEPPEKSARPGF